MNCNQARRLFSACLDRDLTFEEEADLREHLRICVDCADKMASLERVQVLLRGLPETDPGPGFYEAIREKIKAAGADAETAPRRRFSLIGYLGRALAPAVLRPAAGVAFGLVAGLFIGFSGSNQDGAPSPPAESRVDVLVPESASDVSPIADLDLSHLSALSDSLQLDGEEFVLEPYMRDPQRGLVPVGAGYQRTVTNGDGDDQRDVYITF
ncbi:MAG: zf-HC2 domain-containing protein [Candidatus Eisenbacteria sp.]|nr:zf-HC2 domain-containing protein [Candidatus Eisenbacteria bacterium]